MNEPFVELGGRLFTVGEAAFAAAAVIGAVLLVLLIAGGVRAARHARHRAAVESAVSDLIRTQVEMSGRMQTMAEVFGSRQSELNKSLSERLDAVSHRLGQSMAQTQQSTHENLAKLHERLAVIDNAQRNITALSGQMVELQTILSNKQQRGAFGQGRMEAIIADQLPKGAYTFQATLSNGKRPDCLIHLPNGAGDLVIDAKFPLEAYNGLRAAESDDTRKMAAAQFRQDIGKHISDIAERYLIAGETQDMAFMFVPSESVFAELHENFDDMVQRAHRKRVVIVSPSLLMLSIQVVQAVMRDQRMREQAGVIQLEVAKLMVDVGRLDERVNNLKSHFQKTNEDVEQILTSTRKITRHGERIEGLEFAKGGDDASMDDGEAIDMGAAMAGRPIQAAK
jgi:DNA recombination protein RmuC